MYVLCRLYANTYLMLRWLYVPKIFLNKILHKQTMCIAGFFSPACVYGSQLFFCCWKETKEERRLRGTYETNLKLYNNAWCTFDTIRPNSQEACPSLRIQVLSWFYPDFIQISSQWSEDTIRMKWGEIKIYRKSQ